MTELEAIQQNFCPSPFADAVADLFIKGHPVTYLMERYGLTTKEVSALVTWVCETNLRRAK